MEALYQKAATIKRLKEYFRPYLNLLTKPSGKKMFLLLLAMITMQFVTSINYLYKWFLSDIWKSDISLNAYYYLLTYTIVPLDAFLKITTKLAMSLIPEELRELPIFLIIDDTLQAKFGTHFECYQTMFDHAKHGGNQYLKGHCFVALTVRVPIFTANKGILYLNIPIGFRLRGEKGNKLTIASLMIDTAMEILTAYPMVILLCDSWYPKGDILKTVKKHKNLELIANARADTSLFQMKPPRTGKPGRPAEKGKKLDIHTDLGFIRVGDYFIAVKTVLTNLFGDLPIYLSVTTPDVLKYDAYRVFICTVAPERLKQQFRGNDKKLSDSITSQILWLLPLYLYSYRWGIEVMFYEMKNFWSFGLYRLRRKEGIENFVNFSSICYACMQTLPYMDARYKSLNNESPQTIKYRIGEAIRSELFLWRFVSKSENTINSSAFFDEFSSFCSLGSLYPTG
jgi:hypothetical protein